MDHGRIGRVFLLLGAAALLIIPAAWRTGVGGGDCGTMEKVINTGACVSGPGGNIIRNKGGHLLDLNECATYKGRKGDELQFHANSATSTAPFDISRDRNYDLDGDGSPDISVIYDDGTIVSDQTYGTAIDFVRLIQKFMLTHNDVYDIVEFFPNFSHAEGSFFLGIKNGIRGIGEDIADDSATYGTHHLQGFTNYRNYLAYPLDVNERIAGNNDSTMTLLAQETAHRWGAELQFDSDPSSRVKASTDLLGRGLVHWSYFASVPSVLAASYSSSLEGNAWIDLGTGSFQTTNTSGTGGYTMLDQYIMGFRSFSDLPDNTLLIAPDRTEVHTASDTPYTPELDGINPVNVIGAAVNVNKEDILRIEGPRNPDVTQSPKKIRIAFVLLSRDLTNDVPLGDVQRLNGIRVAFANYFHQQTEGIGEAVTTLGDVDLDGDGYTTLNDCDDSDPNINPGVIEGPAYQPSCNFVDDDCDGFVDEGFDADNDFWTVCQGDCNDNDPTINPDAVEIIGDLVDNDCDGLADNTIPVDQDFDGWSPPKDCNDSDPNINPDGIEVVDGVDNNCNGFIDCADPQVIKQSEKGPRRNDGLDNDCNGIIDG